MASDEGPAPCSRGGRAHDGKVQVEIVATPRTVLLVEDDPRARARLADVIEGCDALRLAATAGTFAEGRARLLEDGPDVLLTDLGLPDGDGTDLIRLAAEKSPGTLCMVITVFGDERHVVAAIEAGALGYLLKDGRAESLASSILEMLDGGSPISSAIARHLLRRLRPGEEDAASDAKAEPASEPVPRLSNREQEVLTHVVKGFTTPEIARIMGVSPHTVTTHVRGIYRKLSVSSRGEAVYEALQLGLVKIRE